MSQYKMLIDVDESSEITNISVVTIENEQVKQVPIEKIKDDFNKELISDIEENSQDIERLKTGKADITAVSSPYNFKGNTTYAALPMSGNTVNDTYYCTDAKCKYTWNGTAWYQSSLNEADYEDVFNQISNEIAGCKEVYKNNYGCLEGNYAQGRISNGTFQDNIKYRIATTERITYDYPVTLKADNGFLFYIQSFNALPDGTFATEPIAEYSLNGGEVFMLCIRRENEVTSEIADIEYFKNRVKIDKSKLAYQVEQNKEKINIIENRLKFKDKKICFIGDSMIDVVNTLKPWWKYVADYFGVETIYNRGIGGTKVCADGFYSLIKADGTVHTQNWNGEDSEIPSGCTKIIKSLSRADRASTIPTDTDILVIMAGVNDYSANAIEGDFTYYDEQYKKGFYNVATEFKQAYSAFLEYVHARIPNATVIICTLLNSANTKGGGLTPIKNLPTNQNGNTPKDFRNWTIDVANQFGYFCIDTFSTSGINYLNRNEYCVDDVHPYTENGQKMIARAVIKGISDIPCISDL